MSGLQSNIRNFQKLSDIYDVFDPALDTVIRKELGSRPFANRRQWEFGMIYLSLQTAGHLHGNARGLAMGAGTERLIYAIAPKVEKAVITDLYGMDGGWQGLDTPNPHSLIMKKAPWKIDPDRIEALPMDMRDLRFPDESFDFCWSTGAIEHIGNDADFVQHFNEVWRVLKPGGMYALTTACILGRETARIPHNYYFEPQHLLDLAHESKLQANPVFDCTLKEHSLNDVKTGNVADYGYDAGNSTTPLIELRRGCLVVGNSLILTKSSGPKIRPVVDGLHETTEMARRSLDRLMQRTWTNWQYLNIAPQADSLRCQPQWFGNGAIEMQVFGQQRETRVFSRPLLESAPELVLKTKAGRFEFQAEEGCVYIARITGASADETVLRARRVPSSD